MLVRMMRPKPKLSFRTPLLRQLVLRVRWIVVRMCWTMRGILLWTQMNVRLVWTVQDVMTTFLTRVRGPVSTTGTLP